MGETARDVLQTLIFTMQWQKQYTYRENLLLLVQKLAVKPDLFPDDLRELYGWWIPTHTMLEMVNKTYKLRQMEIHQLGERQHERF